MLNYEMCLACYKEKCNSSLDCLQRPKPSLKVKKRGRNPNVDNRQVFSEMLPKRYACEQSDISRFSRIAFGLFLTYYRQLFQFSLAYAIFSVRVIHTRYPRKENKFTAC